MKSWVLAFAALFLSAASSAAQDSPPPTPVVPCDSNAVMGSRFAPALSIATRTGATAATEQRPTVVSLSSANGAAHYFVAETEVPLARLGQVAAEAWLANTPDASIEQCWDGSDGSAVGVYAIAGRSTTFCRIVIRADDSVSYGALASARNALRDAGFTRAVLTTSDQTRVVFDDHLPLNPVPIRLQGVAPTMVRIMSPPDATEPVIGIVSGRAWNVTPLAQLGENLRREAARNNPALTAEEMNADARICVRPDSTIAYSDVLRVIATIRDYGFVRVGLYSEAVVAIDEQGRRR